MCEYCRSFDCPPSCPSYKPEKVGWCPICEEPIYAGEECYRMPEGDTYHADCFDDEYRWTAE